MVFLCVPQCLGVSVVGFSQDMLYPSPMARNYIADRLVPFGTNIFTTMSKLALQHSAVNLSQGFPDFDGPQFIKDAARDAMYNQPNQYAPMAGIPALRQAIAQRFTARTGIACDPDTMVTVTCGCTEALPASVMGISNPGDEIVFFQPFFDIHKTSVILANCKPVPVTLHRPARGETSFLFNPAELEAAMARKPKAIVLNTPHNPSGKVFTRDELALVAKLCVQHDVIAISDDVYERLTYEPSLPHVPLVSMPGMAERTIALSSMGKTFSMTGWKIGWAVAPAPLTAAVRAAHQFLTFSIATPLQYAAAEALRREDECVPDLVAMLKRNRDELNTALREMGFVTMPAPSGYFILADFTALLKPGEKPDDNQMAMRLISEAGVATIPASAFYADAELGRSMLRFAFCKKPETITEGIRRLKAWRAKMG